jgi:murein DD-endopeptidase MepM/ murein hydrolase activator NlpD
MICNDPMVRTPRRPRSTALLRTVCALLAGGLVTACALPRWPVQGSMTSPFGLRLRGLRPEVHDGVDIAVPEGTPVHAMKAGRVTFTGTMRGYGLTVILDHGGGLQTLYAHLSSIEVHDGDRVQDRQVIGLSGATGDATAPHLHFEIRMSGHPHDPVPLLGAPPGG